MHLGDDHEARAKAREVNEFGADLVKNHPGRFGLFASLPLPHVDTVIGEAVPALDELADGVVLLANCRATYLGDSVLDPLMEALDERDAVVFVHPADRRLS